MKKRVEYRNQTLRLCSGDALYLYTDGVTEAADNENKLYGEPRLLQALSFADDKTTAGEVCQVVTDDIHTFVGSAPQSDDITMLCVKLNAMQVKDRMTTYPDESSYATVESFLNDRLKTADVSARVINRVLVVTDEIWSNIVKYSGATEASVRLGREADTLLVSFTDNGKPFDPLAAEEPNITLAAEEREIGGLGLLIIKKMFTEQHYEYADGQNRLKLGFELK